MTKVRNKQSKRSRVRSPFLMSGYFLVIAVCLIIPLVHIKATLDPVLYPRLLALGITVFVMAVLFYIEMGKKRINGIPLTNGFSIVFLIFILTSTTSLFWAINPIEGTTDILKWISIFLLTIIAIFLLSNSEKFTYLLLKGIIINAILFSIIGLIQYLNNALTNPDPNALYEVKGLMAHKNQYSISLFVLIPFLSAAILKLRKNWKKMAITAFAMAAVVILLLQTRAVWIAFFMSGTLTVLILLLFNSKKKFIELKNKNNKRFVLAGSMAILLFLFLTVFYPIGPLKSINKRIDTVFNPKYTSNEWRIEMWNATTQLLVKHPLTGVGAGNWKIAVYPYYSEYLPSVYRHWRNPHNDYLLTFSEKGILGLLPFMSMFLLLVFYGIRNMVRSSATQELFINSFFVFGIMGYMIISFFSFPSERINHLLFISLMAAFIISENFKNRDVSEGMRFRTALIVLPMLILSYMVIHFGIIAVDSELNIVKAQAAQKEQNWTAMEKYAQKAYSPMAPIEPKFSFPISMYLGIPKYHKGDFERALDYFKKSYHQHPTNISVLNNIGSVYGQMGILDSSIVYHQKSLEIFPHYELGLINLSKAYYLEEDFENAYQTILKCDPRSRSQEVYQVRLAVENKLDY